MRLLLPALLGIFLASSTAIAQLYVPGPPEPTPFTVNVDWGTFQPSNFVYQTTGLIDPDGDNINEIAVLFDQAGSVVTAAEDTFSTPLDVAATTMFDGLGPGTYYIALSATDGTDDSYTFQFEFADAAPFAVLLEGGAQENWLPETATLEGESESEIRVFSDGQWGPGSVDWSRFTVVPTPGATSVVALAGLLANRRRRSA